MTLNTDGLAKFLDDMQNLEFAPPSYYEDYEDVNLNDTEAYYDNDFGEVVSAWLCKGMEVKRNCHTPEVLGDVYCQGEWDQLCWPSALPGTRVKAPCLPRLSPRQSDVQYGYRYCLPNGQWYGTYDVFNLSIPTNFIGACDTLDLNETDSEDTHLSIQSGMDPLRVIYTLGYVVSLLCLVSALLILTTFTRLHCARNYIHINLMVSFIFRYVIVLMRDVVSDLESYSNLGADDEKFYLENCSAGWQVTRCRIMVTLTHYTVISNFFWLLIEGVYLQMLLSLTMVDDKYFAHYMLCGWVGPWLFVLLWMSLRVADRSAECWDEETSTPLWWAIRAPIVISIMINFVIFVNIIRIILSKLRAHNMYKRDYKFRLAKSTLALIPLLGIHYVVVLVMNDKLTQINKDTWPYIFKLATEMVLTSLQGMLIAVFYCFLNDEVQTELQRWWKDLQWEWGIPRSHKPQTKTIRRNESQKTMSSSSYHKHSSDKPLEEKLIVHSLSHVTIEMKQTVV